MAYSREITNWELGSRLLHSKPFILSEIPLAWSSGVTLWAKHFSGLELGFLKEAKTKQNQKQIKQPQQKTLFAGPPSAGNDSFNKKTSLDLWGLWPVYNIIVTLLAKIHRGSCQTPDDSGMGFTGLSKNSLLYWLSDGSPLRITSRSNHTVPGITAFTI